MPTNKISLEDLYRRDKGICGICGSHVTRAEATRDHIVPKLFGGTDRKANMQLAHKLCNQDKSANYGKDEVLRLRARKALRIR